MIKLDDVRAQLDCKSLVHGVDILPNGHVRIETTFRYPDGGSIEIFIPDIDPLLPATALSDLGQTTAWLLDLQIKPWLSRKRQAFLDDVLRLYGVTQNGGALETTFASLDELEPKVVELAQVCLRMSDLIFTRRASLQTSFSEDIEEVLVDGDLTYDANAELIGRYSAPVRVDYLVHGPNRRCALMGWSSGNAYQAHIVANEVFRKWFDLDIPGRTESRITVFDDRYDVYRKDDMDRIRNYSAILALSDRQTIIDAIAA